MIIAVLDDDPLWAQAIAAAAEHCMQARGEDYVIETYTRPDEMLARIRDDEYFDIFLLDVRIGDISGLHLMEELQRTYLVPICIFITDYSNYAEAGYRYNAFRFISKSKLETDLSEALAAASQRRIEQKLLDENGFIFIELHQELIKLLYKDIMYIRKDGKNILIRCRKESYTFRGDLKSIWEKVNHAQFAYSDRGWIINLRYVHETKKEVIVLDNEEEVPLSRGKSSEFREVLRKYLMDHAAR